MRNWKLSLISRGRTPALSSLVAGPGGVEHEKKASDNKANARDVLIARDTSGFGVACQILAVLDSCLFSHSDYRETQAAGNESP